ncbi:MAG: response regulator [Ktedonobacterales bacterium]
MLSVLIVDDEEPIRAAICLLLEDEGFVCLQAADGAEALQVLRASADRMIVLLDLMMPRMSGKDVLNTIAADPSLVGRHGVVVMTAADKTLPLVLVQMMRQMDVPVIGKPFEIDSLLQTVVGVAKQLDDNERAAGAV